MFNKFSFYFLTIILLSSLFGYSQQIPIYTPPSVSSVSNSDGTLTISPTVGAVIASINRGNANTWTATQTFRQITISDGYNLVFGIITGTEIGTATNQKIGFFGTSPIIQPTGDISAALGNLGLVGSPVLPNPGALTLGGIESIAAVASKWINSISTSGVPSLTQPADSDLSFTDITTNNSSTTKHGFCPKLDNVVSHFLNGQGGWTAPAGSSSSGGAGIIQLSDGAGGFTSDANFGLNTTNHQFIFGGTSPLFGGTLGTFHVATDKNLIIRPGSDLHVGANGPAIDTVNDAGSSVQELTIRGNNAYFVGSGNYTGSWTQSSDARWKMNVQPVTGILDRLSQLQLVSFQWNDTRAKALPGLKDDHAMHLGWIGQDVEKVFPEIVVTRQDESGLKDFKQVEYDKSGVLAIQGVKELYTIIQNQQKTIDALKKIVCKDHPGEAICQ